MTRIKTVFWLRPMIEPAATENDAVQCVPVLVR